MDASKASTHGAREADAPLARAAGRAGVRTPRSRAAVRALERDLIRLQDVPVNGGDADFCFGVLVASVLVRQRALIDGAELRDAAVRVDDDGLGEVAVLDGFVRHAVAP